MNLPKATAILASLFIVLGAVGAASAASGSGFVTYSVHAAGMGVTKDFTVNVTSSPSPQTKTQNVILQIVGGTFNFSYSKSINASTQVFPIIPGIANQSFSYSANSTSVSLRVAQNGTLPLQFQGSSYTLTSYSFTADVSYKNYSAIVLGSLAAFPSGLVYSLRGTASGVYSLAVTLKATSLALNAAGGSPASQIVSVGVGAGAAVAALSLSLGIRSRRRHNQREAAKPDYWVD